MELDKSRGKIEIVLDASELDAFQSCACKYNYRYNYSLVPPELNKSLDMGGVIHAGLEYYFKSLQDSKSWEEAVQVGLNKIREALATSSDLETRDGDRVLEVFEENTTHWRQADINLQIDYVEQPFIYILFQNESFRVSMTGKIDLAFTDQTYTKAPMDHKTFSRDFGINRLSNQFINYANATESNWVIANRIGFQTSLKPRDKYKREPLCYDQHYIEQWRQNTIVWAMNYLESVQTGNWPMNPNSCHSFGRLCEYYEVCDTSGEENKERKLLQLFKKAEKWDVSKSLVESKR